MGKRLSNTAGKKKFPFGRFLAWKTSDISMAGLNIIVTTYLAIYCTNFLGLSGTLVGTILLVSNIIDAITDVIAGYIIDNTHSKLGKGRPYELGIVGMWICTFLMFSGPTGASQTVKVVWVFFMYTFIWGVFNTLRGAGSTAYMIRAFDNDRDLLGKVGSYGGIVTTVGSMVVSLTFPMMMGKIATSAAGWSKLVALYAVPLCVLALGRFVFVKENPSIDAGQQHIKVTLKDVWNVFTKNKYVWFYAGMIVIFNALQNMSVQTYYFTYIVGNTDLLGVLSIMGIMMLPVMLFMPLLLKKFSVPKIIMGGGILSMVGYVLNYIAGANTGILCGAAVLMACLQLPISYLCIVILMDLFNYNEYKGLPRLEGTTNQLAHGISGQLGQGLGGFMLGIFLDIREYRYAYGAVEPLTGEGYFLVMPYCNTACMNIFLRKLSEQYSEDIILLCCDGAAWHKSAGLELPENIVLFHIPPYTPEMNPIEQIWKEIRKRGFCNEIFATLEKVVDRLCDTICSLSNTVIASITGRDWTIKPFN